MNLRGAILTGSILGALFWPALDTAMARAECSGASIDGQPVALCTPCPYEDGSPDGQPCLWTDPDTGKVYYLESEAYR